MSLITSCPRCGTMFKVVPDQLRISQGWVRCGHCAEVFDAQTQLSSDQATPVPPLTARATAGRREEEREVPLPDTARRRFDVDAPPLDDDTIPEVMAELASAPTPLVAPLPDPAPPPAWQRFRTDPRMPAARDPVLDDDSPLPLEPAERLESVGPGVSTSSGLPQDVGFLRQGRRRAFWSRPAVRAVLVLCLLLLLGVLGLQMAVQHRDQLAVVMPNARPGLVAMCQVLGCSVGPPRRIEAINIENSAFTRRADGYRLTFTLRNNAAHAVAVPALELTLTDRAEQPVVRRVLTPAEAGSTADALGPGSEWNGSIALEVAANAGASSVAGYRLLAFYP